MPKLRILIADDHNLFRRGLLRILGDYDDLSVVGEAADGEEAVALVERLQPDLVLMDVGMPGMSGPEAAHCIRMAHPQTQVIMLTVSDQDEDLFSSIKAGARGYLLKNAETAELMDAIRRVHAGEAIVAPSMAVRLLEEFGALARAAPEQLQTDDLTEREIEVLRLVAQGLANKEIADRLSLSEHTVKSHLRNILDKLHLRSRAHAAAYAVQAGLVNWVQPDE
ncbi:MAG: response regulator [Anaerolineae bacterium]